VLHPPTLSLSLVDDAFSLGIALESLFSSFLFPICTIHLSQHLVNSPTQSLHLFLPYFSIFRCRLWIEISISYPSIAKILLTTKLIINLTPKLGEKMIQFPCLFYLPVISLKELLFFGIKTHKLVFLFFSCKTDLFLYYYSFLRSVWCLVTRKFV